MNVCKVNEEEALVALISAFSPPNPSTTRQSWLKNSYYGNSAPTTKVIWKKLEESDFSCVLCDSQMRLTIDHINGDPKDHSDDNLRILCSTCNRRHTRSIPAINVNNKYAAYKIILELTKELGRFPRFTEIASRSGSVQYAQVSPLVKWMKSRMGYT